MKLSLPTEELSLLLKFLDESTVQLEGIEDKVLQMEVSINAQLTDSILQPIHTITEASSSLNLQNITRLSHEAETLLSNIKKGRIEIIDAEIIDLLLETIAGLSGMLGNISSAVGNIGDCGDTIAVDFEEVECQDLIDRFTLLRESGNQTEAREQQPVPHTFAETPVEPGPTRQTLPPYAPGAPIGKPAGPAVNVDYSRVSFPGEMKSQFIAEGVQHLGEVEHILLRLEKSPGESALLHDLFRALHSLKGNSGVILSAVENDVARKNHFLNQFRELAHTAESIVQHRRDEKCPLPGEEIEALLAAGDGLKLYLNAFKDNRVPVMDIQPLAVQLKNLVNAPAAPSRAGDSIGGSRGDFMEEAVTTNINQALEAIEAGLAEIAREDKRRSALKKLKRSYRNLTKIGKKINHGLLVQTCSDCLDILNYLNVKKDQNEELFLENLKKGFRELKRNANRRNEQCADRRQTMQVKPPGESERRVTDKVLNVSRDRIETFVNLAGELLVSKNNLIAFQREVSGTYDLPGIATPLKEVADSIARISNDLQANIIAIRMLPVYSVFSKFPRVIRDLSRKLGKKIKLEISGEETEIDKNIIEALADPLVHMIRNSVDHGIETPPQRTFAGKPEEGVIKLHAFSRGQAVILEISDDGKGITAKEIRKKAVEKKLMPPEELEKLDDRQVLQLIFLPGFSMAGQVSYLSGRGVGLDVAKTNIEKLDGDIKVESRPGKGTSFSIELPLTLDIGRGLEVECGGNRYYVPLESIIETLRVPAGNIFKGKHGEMIVIRDECFSVHRLRERLQFPSLAEKAPYMEQAAREKDSVNKESLILLEVKNQKLGLVVDNYFNKNEYVIKPLTGPLANIEGISGAMLTGEGKIKLILDLLRLF
ncbi:MAG: hypothetical protein GY765_27270 [bacterium]|nr:hypothetical protein [bacterium]